MNNNTVRGHNIVSVIVQGFLNPHLMQSFQFFRNKIVKLNVLKIKNKILIFKLIVSTIIETLNSMKLQCFFLNL